MKINYRSGLSRVGEGMEGSLHFICEEIILISVFRLILHWIFGI